MLNADFDKLNPAEWKKWCALHLAFRIQNLELECPILYFEPQIRMSRYVTLFRRGRIFAIRLLGEVNIQISDKETPFFERASLGGGSALRGYSTGRFRDKDLILLNLEYRYPIWDSSVERRGAMDAVIFADIGRVFDDLVEETFKDYKISYGVGIRARTPQDFVFRAEIALSSEETNIIFKFEPMF